MKYLSQKIIFKMQNNNKNNISGILIYIKFSNKNIVGVTSFNTDWSLEKLCSVCTEATEKKKFVKSVSLSVTVSFTS